jgi:hypothetical protein
MFTLAGKAVNGGQLSARGLRPAPPETELELAV